MPRRARPLALLLGAAIAISACQALPPINVADGVLVDGWVFPTAAPLPDGAVRLPLDVATPPQDVPADVEMGACPAALHGARDSHRGPTRPNHRRCISSAATEGRSSSAGRTASPRGRSMGSRKWSSPMARSSCGEGELSRVDLGGGGSGANDDTFGVCITGAPSSVARGGTDVAAARSRCHATTPGPSFDWAPSPYYLHSRYFGSHEVRRTCSARASTRLALCSCCSCSARSSRSSASRPRPNRSSSGRISRPRRSTTSSAATRRRPAPSSTPTSSPATSMPGGPRHRPTRPGSRRSSRP